MTAQTTMPSMLIGAEETRELSRHLERIVEERSAPPALFAFAQQLAAFVTACLQLRWPGAQVDCFGSCASGLAGRHSDVDLVAFGHPGLCRGDGAAIKLVGDELKRRSAELAGFRLTDIKAIASARVPVLKLSATSDDAGGDGGPMERAVDVTLGNPVAARNSALLRAYGEAGGGVARQLLVLVRAWAKARRVSTVYREHTPSPYAHCCLVIAFLQIKDVAPRLQQRGAPTELVDGLDVAFDATASAGVGLNRAQRRALLKAGAAKAAPQWELSSLLEEYLRWLSGLDAARVVVSPRLGACVPKSAHWHFARVRGALHAWTPRGGKAAAQAASKWRLSIEV